MPLIICKDCKKEFSDDARRCVHCGAKPPIPAGCLNIFFLFSGILTALIIITMISPNSAEKENKNPRIIPTLQQATDNLSYCIIPKIQYGHYSSYDGGKSALKLMQEDCLIQSADYIDACERDKIEGCTLQAGILIQSALKMLNK